MGLKKSAQIVHVGAGVSEILNLAIFAAYYNTKAIQKKDSKSKSTTKII